MENRANSATANPVAGLHRTKGPAHLGALAFSFKIIEYLVPEAGLEPASLAAADFESAASTSSATRARIGYRLRFEEPHCKSDWYALGSQAVGRRQFHKFGK